MNGAESFRVEYPLDCGGGVTYWGRGIATAALQRICSYAFKELGLLRVFATPLVTNPASLRVLEKAGFAREGVMRNACIKDGRLVDMALYAKIPPENKTYTLETARLVLRLMQPGDAQSVFDTYSSDPEAARYMTFVTQTDVTEAASFLEWQRAQFDDGKSVLWAILDGVRHDFMGAIEIRVDDGEGDVGFIIGRPHWGNGYVAEALTAVLNFAKGTLRLRRVHGRCDVANVRSARVFEKAGFRTTGIATRSSLHPNLSDTLRDTCTFAFDL
jgi:[ribosomal protein S5]-alanine N-acetyltransferase